MIAINNKRSQRIHEANKHIDNLVGQRLTQAQADKFKQLLLDAVVVGQNLAIRKMTDPINHDKRLGYRRHSRRDNYIMMLEMMKSLENEDYQSP